MTAGQHLCIVGCGGHARSVADIALGTGITSLVFIDPNAGPGETIFGFPVLAAPKFDGQMATASGFIVGIGDNANREAAFARYRRVLGGPPRRVIARDVHIGRDAVLGDGVFIGARAHIGPLAQIGDDVIINTRAIVEHEAVIGAHSHVAVDALLLGRARVGERVLVGARAVVLDGRSVASDVVIGAGALVTRDIDGPGTYVGVPARRTS